MLGSKRINILEYSYVSILLVVAFCLRFYRLDHFSLNHDEAYWMLLSPQYWIYFLHFPVGCFDGVIHPLVSFNIFLFRHFLSDPIYIVRMPNVIIGTLTIILMYLVAKKCYGKGVAFLSATFLCVLPWHVIESRSGLEHALIPFLGCLLMIVLIDGMRKKSNRRILLFSWLLSCASFYTYQVAILFTPTFVLTVLVFHKELSWVKKKTIVLGLFLYFGMLVPIIYLEAKGEINYILNFMHTHGVFFSEGIIHNIRNNSIRNIRTLITCLFFTNDRALANAVTLNSPLLISPVLFCLAIISMVQSLVRRKGECLMPLIWLFIGIIGCVPFIRYFRSRYALHVMIPLVLLASNGLMAIYYYGSKQKAVFRSIIIGLLLILCLNIITHEAVSLQSFFKRGPFDEEECRRNSYGCKEAATYLNEIPDIQECVIEDDFRMTLDAYLNFPQKGLVIKMVRKEGMPRIYKEYPKLTKRYYVLWAPESHTEDMFRGYYVQKHNSFKKLYPQAQPVHTVFYPNGLPAIHIYYVDPEESGMRLGSLWD